MSMNAHAIIQSIIQLFGLQSYESIFNSELAIFIEIKTRSGIGCDVGSINNIESNNVTIPVGRIFLHAQGSTMNPVGNHEWAVKNHVFYVRKIAVILRQVEIFACWVKNHESCKSQKIASG